MAELAGATCYKPTLPLSVGAISLVGFSWPHPLGWWLGEATADPLVHPSSLVWVFGGGGVEVT